MAECDWIVDLIADNGRTVSITALSGVSSSTQPWRGNNPAQTTLPAANVIAVFSTIKRNAVDRSLVRDGDMWAYVANTGVAVDSYEFVTDGSVKWKIVKCHVIKPGSEILLYKLHLRR